MNSPALKKQIRHEEEKAMTQENRKSSGFDQQLTASKVYDWDTDSLVQIKQMMNDAGLSDELCSAGFVGPFAQKFAMLD
jgi:hypothetical protein